MQAIEVPTLDAGVVALYKAARLAQRLTKDDPVDVAQSRVLLTIVRIGPVRPSAVAHEVHIDLSTASRHIDTLVKQGYVAKAGDPQDARASLVAVTPRGRRVVNAMIANRTRAIEPALSAWSAQDRDLLVSLLSRLADDLDSHLLSEESR